MTPSPGPPDCHSFREQILWPLVRPGSIGAFVSDIFREIDEELRRDNFRKLWSRYGRYVIAAAVFVLVVAGAIVAWRDHQLSERRAQSTRYASALALAHEGKEADAVKVFAAIAQEGGGYAVLHLLKRRRSWRNRATARQRSQSMIASQRRASSIPASENSRSCSRSCRTCPRAIRIRRSNGSRRLLPAAIRGARPRSN